MSAPGKVLLVGCGPGAGDLLTLRAVNALRSADIVVWNASLLARAVVDEHMRADAELLMWPPATQRDVLAAYDRALSEGLTVARLKGGDPVLYGALDDDLRALRKRGIPHETVPGVSALSAAGAALQCELARVGGPLLVVAAGDHDAGTEPPAAEAIVMYGGGGRDGARLQASLSARGLPADARCSVAIELSRAAEALVHCRLDELAETLEDHASGTLAVVVAKRATAPI